MAEKVEDLVITAWEFGRQEVAPKPEYLRAMAKKETGRLKDLLLEYANVVETGKGRELSEISGEILGTIARKIKEVVEQKSI
jgi:hypothetical protein